MTADATGAVDPAGVYTGLLRRWRAEVSTTLQKGNFEVYVACVPGKAGGAPVEGLHAPTLGSSFYDYATR